MTVAAAKANDRSKSLKNKMLNIFFSEDNVEKFIKLFNLESKAWFPMLEYSPILIGPGEYSKKYGVKHDDPSGLVRIIADKYRNKKPFTDFWEADFFKKITDSDMFYDTLSGFITGMIPAVKETWYQAEDEKWYSNNEDLSDRQKGIAYQWIKKLLFDEDQEENIFDYWSSFSENTTLGNTVRTNLRYYFGLAEQIRKLEPKYDTLTNIPNVSSLIDLLQRIRSTLTNPQSRVTNQTIIKKANQVSDLEKLFEDGKWHAYIPHTWEASRYLCQGSTWCIAGKSKYEYYHSEQCPIIIVIDSSKPFDKYALVFSRNEFKSPSNYMMNKKEFNIFVDLLEKYGYTKKYPCIDKSKYAIGK